MIWEIKCHVVNSKGNDEIDKSKRQKTDPMETELRIGNDVLWIGVALVTKHMIKMIYNINLNIQPKDTGLDTRENLQFFLFFLVVSSQINYSPSNTGVWENRSLDLSRPL